MHNSSIWFLTQLQTYLTKFMCRTPGMLMYFGLFLLQFQTNKSIAIVGGPPGQPEIWVTIVMDTAYSTWSWLSLVYTVILHRFTQTIFFNLFEAVLDAKNDSRQGTSTLAKSSPHWQVQKQAHWQEQNMISTSFYSSGAAPTPPPLSFTQAPRSLHDAHTQPSHCSHAASYYCHLFMPASVVISQIPSNTHELLLYPVSAWVSAVVDAEW